MLKNFKTTFINWKKFMNMEKANKFNLADENLVEVVKKWQNLYDKSFPG